MICWFVFFGAIIAFISLIIFSEKVYKIYIFILGFFLKILNFVKFMFKVIRFIFLNLDVIFKYLIYSILTLTALIFITNFTEFLIILLKNFIIGLKEAFSNSTREGKLYYISLYIILAYVFINKREVSLKIYKYIEIFKNKYFNSKNKENVEKYKSVILFLGVYISICAVGFTFYRLTGGEWDQKNASNIINIFTWATYLIAPMAVIWAYINWKSPKQYELEKEYAEKLLENINEVYFYMFERVNNLKYLSTINEHVVLLNGISRNTKKYSDTPFYLAHGYLELLNSIAKKQIDKSVLINFERMAQVLDGQSNYIEQKYELYYEPLSADLKNNNSITSTTYNGIILTKEQLFAKVQLNWYMNDKLESEIIEETGQKIIINLTYKEYIDKFRAEYELLINEIVFKYIKIEES